VNRKPGQQSTVAMMLSIIHSIEEFIFSGRGAGPCSAPGTAGADTAALWRPARRLLPAQCSKGVPQRGQ